MQIILPPTPPPEYLPVLQKSDGLLLKEMQRKLDTIDKARVFLSPPPPISFIPQVVQFVNSRQKEHMQTTEKRLMEIQALRPPFFLGLTTVFFRRRCGSSRLPVRKGGQDPKGIFSMDTSPQSRIG